MERLQTVVLPVAESFLNNLSLEKRFNSDQTDELKADLQNFTPLTVLDFMVIPGNYCRQCRGL